MRIALLSVFAIIAFASCTKKTVVNQTVDQAFSAIYTIQPNQWALGTDGGPAYYYATLTVPELTASITDNGGVEVYVSFDFDDASVAAPTYETLPEVVDNVAYGSLHTDGTVTIDLRRPNGIDDMTGAITKAIQVKVVLIDAAPLD